MIYVVIDLKALVKSFNREDGSWYAGNPRESFFFASSRTIFLVAKVSQKLDITNHYHCIHYSLLRALTSCRPGSGRRMVPHIYLSRHR